MDIIEDDFVTISSDRKLLEESLAEPNLIRAIFPQNKKLRRFYRKLGLDKFKQILSTLWHNEGIPFSNTEMILCWRKLDAHTFVLFTVKELTISYRYFKLFKELASAFYETMARTEVIASSREIAVKSIHVSVHHVLNSLYTNKKEDIAKMKQRLIDGEIFEFSQTLVLCVGDYVNMIKGFLIVQDAFTYLIGVKFDFAKRDYISVVYKYDISDLSVLLVPLSFELPLWVR